MHSGCGRFVLAALAAFLLTLAGLLALAWLEPGLDPARAALDGYRDYLKLLAAGAEPEQVFAAFGRFQVLCALRQGPFGVAGLNQAIEAELRASIDVAAKHGIPGLICFSGNRQPFQTEIEAIEACADGFKRVAPYAEEKGINLNMELLNSKVDHPGYQCDHTAWGVAVCERVNSPRVKLLYDIYHMQIMEGDLIRTIRDNIEYIGHFHTGGNPGRNEIDDTQEIHYRAVMQAIAETGTDMMCTLFWMRRRV